MSKRANGVRGIVDRAERSQNVVSPAPHQEQPDYHQDDISDIGEGGLGEEPSCTIKQLPPRLQFKAAAVAAMINPVNEPVFGHTAAVSEGVLPTPLAIAVVTSKYWGPRPPTLTVSF